MPIVKRISHITFALTIIQIARIVLGVFSQGVIAGKFGASQITDAYFVSFTIPQILSDFLIGGTLFIVLIPILIEYKIQNGEEAAWKIATTFLSLTFTILIIFSVLYAAFAPSLIRLLAPFLDNQTSQLAISMTRTISPVIISFGLVMISGAILHSYKCFIVPAIAGTVLPLVMIVSVGTFYQRLGGFSLVLGAVVGSFGQLLIQMALLWRLKKRDLFYINLNHPGVKRTLRLILPIGIAVIVGQVNGIYQKMLASGLESGSIAALNFAGYLANIIPSIFLFPFITVLLPFFSQQSAKNEIDNFRQMSLQGIGMVNFVSIPLSFLIMIFNLPITRLVFEYGHFDVHDTNLTSVALFYYTIGIFAMAINLILVRGFYAFKDYITPMKMAIGTAIISIPLNLVLARFLGIGGLALSTSILWITGIFILGFYFIKKFKLIGIKAVVVSFVKTCIASFLMAGVSIYIFSLFKVNIAMRLGHYAFFSLTVSIIVGMVIFVLFSYLLRIRELGDIVKVLAKK